jgi:hypothetical protein
LNAQTLLSELVDSKNVY